MTTEERKFRNSIRSDNKNSQEKLKFLQRNLSKAQAELEKLELKLD